MDEKNITPEKSPVELPEVHPHQDLPQELIDQITNNKGDDDDE